MIIIIPDSIIEADIKRLTNQMWKLIPMRENEENWQVQLNTVIIEIAGLSELSPEIINDKFSGNWTCNFLKSFARQIPQLSILHCQFSIIH